LDATAGTDAKGPGAAKPFNLRGRRLEGAILYSANLRELDFSGADLQGAYLIYADLRGAHFHCAVTALNPDENGPSAANLTEACTHLEGATLDGAHMEDADLDGAQLQGASMEGALLQGATLDGANLEGADLQRANFDATSMDGADLRAAELDGAEILGAELHATQLQGATLAGTKIGSSLLDTVYLWRASFSGATVGENLVKAPMLRALQPCGVDSDNSCPFGPQEYATLRGKVEAALPETGNWNGNRNLNRRHALERLAQRLDPAAAEGQRGVQTSDWAELSRRSPTDRAFQALQSAQWKNSACAIDDEPYPLEGVEERLGEEPDRGLPLDASKLTLIRILLAGADCPGMNDLPANRKRRLEQLLSNSP
jgi:uncharacterized protein YjbI with pentapeptide repeats